MSKIRTVRHDKLSVFQSMVDDFVRRREYPRDPGTVPARPTLDHPIVHAATVYAERVLGADAVPQQMPEELAQHEGGANAWECVKLAGDLFMARIEGRHSEASLLEDNLKMGTCDLEWVESILCFLTYFGPSGQKAPIPYVTWRKIDDFVLESLPRNATVALVGDWGTGTIDARHTLEQMARKKPDAVIHMGDIYYSGTADETQRNFLNLFNEVFDRASPLAPAAVYTMAGNHDMYSGGAGFYSLLRRLNPSPPFDPGQAQPASFFCLRSRGGLWQFLVMDTGYHDHDPFDVNTDVTYLESTEAAWHLDKIERFHAAGGKTILLSHHQLSSAFETIGKGAAKPAGQEAFNPRLLATFKDVLQQGKISAWFWGHEHNLCIYEPFPPLNRGRCIGHGAIPVLGCQDPYRAANAISVAPRLVRDPVTGSPLELPRDAHGVYRHGYVLLKLNDSQGTAEASYYIESDENTPLYRETLD
jgi:hypothetical protein